MEEKHFMVDEVEWVSLTSEEADTAVAAGIGGLIRVIVWVERAIRWAVLAFRSGRWLLTQAPADNPRPDVVYDPATKYLWRRQADGSYRPSGIKMD